MIFHRRVIQEELNNLRRHIHGFEVDRLVKRLNEPDRERLSRMWEVLVLSALCDLGPVEVEKEIEGGNKPDVHFNGDPNFIADITSISDQGIEDRNPVSEFSMEIERVKSALGMPTGGVDFRIESIRRPLGSGSAVDLRIPNRPQLRDFIERRIAPEIESRFQANELPIRIVIDDDEAKLTLIIDPSKGPYSSGSYPSFDVTEAVDRNPFANALQRKADQLRNACGLKGIIVCDTGSSSIKGKGFDTVGFSPQKIVHHFLRQHCHIDFVIALSVWEQQFGPLQRGKCERRVDVTLYAARGLPCEEELKKLRDKLAARLPKPRATGENGRRQAAEPVYRWGFHGGYSMSDRSVKISLREMTELLAGRLTVEEVRGRHAGMPGGSREFPDQFDRMLVQGRLPVSVQIESGRYEDDDWIEFTFGDPDSAISPFV
jgi:GrpB-like predicted nucleotidyltransferase (UPF0157 family)